MVPPAAKWSPLTRAGLATESLATRGECAMSSKWAKNVGSGAIGVTEACRRVSGKPETAAPGKTSNHHQRPNWTKIRIGP
jgi:hypothetical protein